MKVTSTKIISTSSENMNSAMNEKYGLKLNWIKKNHYQAKGSEHYLVLIELSKQKKYMTDRIGSITKNKEQKEKTCDKISILQKINIWLVFFC